MNENKLLTREDCTEEDNYTGQYVVLRPGFLKEEYRTIQNQVFYASCGFGCEPDKLGTAVFGSFLIDGEECRVSRCDVIGVIKPEVLDQWLKEYKGGVL